MLIRFREIDLHLLAETWMIAQWREPDRQALSIPVRGSGAGGDERTWVREHSSADLVIVTVDLHEVVNEHLAVQRPAIAGQNPEHHGTDLCDQRP